MIRELVLKNRSYRRFDESHRIGKETLLQLIDLARLSPSAANLQSLKYSISNEPEKNAVIYRCLRWAGYLQEWDGPAEGERPSAYIIVLGDTSISNNFHCDHGIACQSILLGAVEAGLGGCIIGSVDREKLREDLNIPERYEILLVIAIGRPVERVQIEKLPEDGSIKYYRDEKGVHHVPKRSLDEIVLEL